MNKEATKLQRDMNEVNNQSKADLDVSGVELARLDKVVTELDKEVANADKDVELLQLQLDDAEAVAKGFKEKLTKAKVILAFIKGSEWLTERFETGEERERGRDKDGGEGES